MLAAFAALVHGSVYLVLGWMAFVPPLMATQQHLLRSGEWPLVVLWLQQLGPPPSSIDRC